MNFKEWFSSQTSNKPYKKAIERIVSSIKKLFFFSFFKEEISTTVPLKKLPDELYSTSQNDLYKWIQKFNPSYTPRKNHKTAEGQEGIALFLGNEIVIKFTLSQEEANIARMLKGNKNFPVIDVIKYKNLYLIAMHELSEVSKSLEKDLDIASFMLFEYLEYIEELEKQGKNPYDYYNNQYLKYWIDNEKDDANDNVKKILFDLFQLVCIILKKTGGYVLGHDWAPNNLGIDKNNKITSFDFGRSRKYAQKSPKQPTIPEIK